LLTVTSVSPKYCLRSLWPMMTYSTPMETSIGAEISPVKAPEFSQWQFSAPTLIFVPFARLEDRGQIDIGHADDDAAFRAREAQLLSARDELAGLAGVLFIFQLPAMTAFLSFLFIVMSSFQK
jgi:hypothetical protein